MLHGFGKPTHDADGNKALFKPLSTTYSDSDAMEVDSFRKFNAAKESSARDQSPA